MPDKALRVLCRHIQSFLSHREKPGGEGQNLLFLDGSPTNVVFSVRDGAIPFITPAYPVVFPACVCRRCLQHELDGEFYLCAAMTVWVRRSVCQRSMQSGPKAKYVSDPSMHGH